MEIHEVYENNGNNGNNGNPRSINRSQLIRGF